MICGKTIYATSREAIEAIKGLMKSGPRIGEKPPSKAYFCEDCQGYHLATESKSQKKFFNEQKTPQEIDSTHPSKKKNDKKFKDLIIHEARKFKVK